jgi:surface antigen
MGVAVGGLVGNSIGHTMDEENSRSVGSGTATSTSIYSDPSPIAYNSYAPNYVAPPTPPPIYVNQQSGAYCREYSQEIRIDGQIQESYGTACLQPDGSWRVVQ